MTKLELSVADIYHLIANMGGGHSTCGKCDALRHRIIDFAERIPIVTLTANGRCEYCGRFVGDKAHECTKGATPHV